LDTTTTLAIDASLNNLATGGHCSRSIWMSGYWCWCTASVSTQLGERPTIVCSVTTYHRHSNTP